LLVTGSLALFGCGVALAHDPVFGPGPHVLYKEGVEVHIGVHREKAGQEKEAELGLELTYGLTGDWAAGIELPYVNVEEGANESNGAGDARLFTKYRFWRKDSLGLQESAAVLLNVMLDNGDDKANPPLGSGTTDTLLGFTYGYESLTWYRWTSIRYRRNGENSGGLRRGDRWLVDFALGYRPTFPVYLKPDTVWILELNGERGQRAELNGSVLTTVGANAGGTEWFISPGIFWTQRNFAIKAGVQFPIANNLKGNQDESDYRAKMEFEWHL
jgi:hypothetical protein